MRAESALAVVEGGGRWEGGEEAWPSSVVRSGVTSPFLPSQVSPPLLSTHVLRPSQSGLRSWKSVIAVTLAADLFSELGGRRGVVSAVLLDRWVGEGRSRMASDQLRRGEVTSPPDSAKESTAGETTS